MKHPHLVKRFKRDEFIPGSGICIELCPISNELLHLCRKVKEHPYPELLAAGIPCTVNSDNPSLFRYEDSYSAPRLLFLTRITLVTKLTKPQQLNVP